MVAQLGTGWPCSGDPVPGVCKSVAPFDDHRRFVLLDRGLLPLQPSSPPTRSSVITNIRHHQHPCLLYTSDSKGRFL